MRPDSPTKQDPAQRLVLAAIGEIEKHGLAKLTVRNVASASGMNIAAVNYHFRSKDALVRAALDGTARHMVQDSQDFLDRMPDDPEGVLTELLTYYFEGAVRYPQINKAHMHDSFIDGDYGGAFPTLFAPVMERLRDELRRAVPGLDLREAGRRVAAALSAVLFPALFGELFRPVGALASASDRRAYAEEIARSALAPREAAPRVRKVKRVK